MQLARLFSWKMERGRDDPAIGSVDWEELERLTARLGVLHGRLESAEAVGHFGTVNTLERDLKRVWSERQRLLDRLINRVVDQAAA
jgi:hypothetical protein